MNDDCKFPEKKDSNDKYMGLYDDLLKDYRKL